LQLFVSSHILAVNWPGFGVNQH